MTLKDIEGEASVTVNQDLVVIPQANIISDEAEVAAKVAFTPDNRTGMIYARYKKLDVLLKLLGQKQDMDIIKVRDKFDSYELKY